MELKPLRVRVESIHNHYEEAKMKQFSCGAVVPGCTATFSADTDEGILTQVAEHARRDHGMDTVPSEVADQVRANIVSR
jgi:predicted small metal-binding protein